MCNHMTLKYVLQMSGYPGLDRSQEGAKSSLSSSERNLCGQIKKNTQYY